MDLRDQLHLTLGGGYAARPARIAQCAFAAVAIAVAPRASAAQSEKAWCAMLPRAANASLTPVSVPSEWFKVYRAADGVYAIVEPFQSQEAISYLILGTKRAMLFDTGIGVVPIRPVVESLTKLPVLVLNSHTHFDHVGGNWEFTNIGAMDTPFTHANEAGQPHARVAGEVRDESFCHGPPAGLDTAAYRSRPWHASETARDGTTYDIGGRTLEVLATPGHTPDAIALLDRAHGLLWTGDSFYDGTIWLFSPETDLDAYEKSIARMNALAPSLKQLLPAHNTANVAPGQLAKTLAAIRAIRSGSAKGHESAGGQITFEVDGITVLTSKAAIAKP
jgi:glyoxylase-like metal-dependent hydrolase (beta-lactamase superfamily II)